jgi:hypothetical protein
MKIFLLAVTCLGLALANINPRFQQASQSNEDNSSEDSQETSYETLRKTKNILEPVFRAGRQYKFIYNGQVMTGIPGTSQQHAGTRIQATVVLQVKDQQQAVLKLTEVRMGKLNSDIPNPRHQLPFRAFEKIQIEQELLHRLELPIHFMYTEGMISDVVFEKTEQPWSANIKRGVINMLQVNLKQTNQIETEESRWSNQIRLDSEEEIPVGQSRYYRVMEKTMEGECETVYEVGRRPSRHPDSSSRVLNVTKSIDFESCTVRPQIKYNWRFEDNCPTCEEKYQDDEKYLKSSTVVKYNITGTRQQFLIESAEVESQYIFVPFDQESSVVATYVKQRLEVVHASRIEHEIPLPVQPVPSDSNLLYTMDWDMLKEKFFMEGENEFHTKSPYSQIPDKVQLVSELLRHLVSSMGESIEESAPRTFSRLVTILRMCSRSEIEQIHNTLFERSDQFTPEEQKKIRDVLVSANALAGTKDSMSHLLRLIKEKKVTGWVAASALRQLMSTRVVSSSMVNELKTFCQHEPVMTESKALKQACWLTFGSLINALCSPNEDQLAVEIKYRPEVLCPSSLKEQTVQTLFNELKRSESWEDQLLLMKAIANAGLDISIQELEKVIYGREKRYPTFLRVEAILALKNLRDEMPRKIRRVLVPIYMNPREYPEVRVTALYEIINTFPERPLLELITKNLNTEPSRQVASFAYSYLSTLANSTNPCYKNMTEDIKMALRFTKVIRPGAQYSKFVHLPLHNVKHSIGGDLNLANIMSNVSMIPFHSAMSLDTNWLGFWNRHLMTLGFSSEGLEPLFYEIFGQKGAFDEKLFRNSAESKSDSKSKSKSKSNSKESNEKSSEKPFLSEMRQVFEKLNIKSRSFTRSPKAWFYLKLKGQEIGFLPFDKQWISEIMSKTSGKLRHYQNNLQNGLPVNFNKATILSETEYKIPTTIGLPLVFTHKIPAIMTLKGKIQMKKTPEKGYTFIVDVTPSISATSVYSIEIWSPIVNSGLKLRSNIRVSLPMKGKLLANLRQPTKDFKITVQIPKVQKEIFVMDTRPITYTLVWPKSLRTWQEPEEKTVQKTNKLFDRISTFEQSYGKQALGVQLKIRSRLNRNPTQGWKGLSYAPFFGPNKISVHLIPSQNQPEEIEIKIETILAKLAKESDSANLKKYLFSKSDSSSEESQQKSREVKRTSKSSESVERFTSPDMSAMKKNEIKIQMSPRGSSEIQWTMNMNLIHKYSRNLLFNKISAKFFRTPMGQYASKPFSACLNAEMAYPKKPYTEIEARSKKVVAEADLKWGQTCEEEEKFVTLKIQAERSDIQRKYEMETDEDCEYYKTKGIVSPVSCYEKYTNMADLQKYKFQLEYGKIPASMRNVTEKLFRYLKYRYFWQTDVAHVTENQRNKILAKITIDPESCQKLNVSIKTPTQNVTIIDLPLPMTLTPINTKRSIFAGLVNSWTAQKFDSEADAICKVNDKMIRTFDGVKYRVPISTCYSVLAKDCTEENRFAVYLKKISESTEMKKMKIVTPRHKIVLTPMEGRIIKIQVNDKEYDIDQSEPIMEHGHVIVEIEREGPYVKVDLVEADVRVYFDGYATNIKMSSLYMHRQCGLCGHFDSESDSESEFLGPDFQHNSDIRQFFKNYLIAESDCSVPEVERICADSQCEYQSEPEEEEEYWNQIQNQRKYEKSDRMVVSGKKMEPILKTKKVEQSGRTCFSLTKVPICPSNTYAIKYGKQREVQYRCVSNMDSRVLDLMDSEETSDVDTQLSDIRHTLTKMESIPKLCKRF